MIEIPINQLSLMTTLFNFIICVIVAFIIRAFYIRYSHSLTGKNHISSVIPILSAVIFLVIVIVKSSLALSLGLVGALSIVRFRTPIKDPLDLVFIFWAITVGIANGVGYFNISIIGSIVMTLVILIMTRRQEEEQPYLFVLQVPNGMDSSIAIGEVKKSVERYMMKSNTITDDYEEITAEVRLKGDDTSFIRKLHEDNKVLKATLITYSGDLAQI